MVSDDVRVERNLARAREGARGSEMASTYAA